MDIDLLGKKETTWVAKAEARIWTDTYMPAIQKIDFTVWKDPLPVLNFFCSISQNSTWLLKIPVINDNAQERIYTIMLLSPIHNIFRLSFLEILTRKGVDKIIENVNKKQSLQIFE